MTLNPFIHQRYRHISTVLLTPNYYINRDLKVQFYHSILNLIINIFIDVMELFFKNFAWGIQKKLVSSHENQYFRF